jgi:AbiV family abortive infection protein
VVEANLLYKEGHFARSLLLAYFATEEAAKTVHLGAVIVDAALPRPIDWRDFWCRWNDHEPKSLTASHTQAVIDGVAALLESGGSMVEGDRAYIVPYDMAALRRNAQKARRAREASLYVDWQPDVRAVVNPTAIDAAGAADAIKIASDHASAARGQFVGIFSSPATFEAVVEATRTGRPFITVMQERGVLPPE